MTTSHYPLRTSAGVICLAIMAALLVPFATRAAPQTQATLTVVSLTLINAVTDQPIGELKDGATIDLKKLGTSQLSVVATTNPARVGSVTFALDGQVIQTENFAPYSIKGDAPKQGGRNYLPWTPPAGKHTLVVTPYSQARGQGQTGTPMQVTFTVTNGIAVTPQPTTAQPTATPAPSATATTTPAPSATPSPTPNAGGQPTCTATVARSGGTYTSLQAAANAAKPGDIVCVRGGVYKEYVKFNNSGAAGKPITFMAWPGEKVIFDGSDRAPNPASPNDAEDIFMVSGDYLVFRGFELTRSARSGLLGYEGDHNRYESMIFSNNFSAGINIYIGSDNVIVDSVAHHNNGTGGYNSDGFKVYQGSRNIFRHNIAYANSDDGFDTWIGRENLLEYNLSYENGYGRNPNGSDDDGDGVGFKLGGLVDQRRGGLNIARFNVAYRNRGAGFDMNAGEKNRIHNNTICRNALDVNSFGPGGNEFKNNIACDNSVRLLNNDSAERNTWSLNMAGLRFVNDNDPTSRDFLRLAPNSPAIDAGVDVGQSFAGKAPDLGAFEVGLPWPR